MKLFDQVVDSFAGEVKYSDDWDLPGLLTYVERNVLPLIDFTTDDLVGMTKHDMKEFLRERTFKLYEAREAEMGSETMRELEKAVMLNIIDEKWMDHIDAMDQLRNEFPASLRAKDPLIEYKFEAFDAFIYGLTHQRRM